MNSIEIHELNSDYPVATRCLQELLGKGILSATEINQILALKNTLIISDFLIQYKHFSKENLVKINKYIIRKKIIEKGFKIK